MNQWPNDLLKGGRGMKPEDETPAVAHPFEQGVGRPEPERAEVGDVVATDVTQPRPETLRLTLDTQAAADHFNALPAAARIGWRLEKRIWPPRWRICEFCGCNTNARLRACCEQGRDADLKTPNAEVTGGPALPAPGRTAAAGRPVD